MEPTQIRLTIPDSVDPTALMGPSDVLLRRIEEALDTLISVRGSSVTISGPASDAERAVLVFSRLITMVEAGSAPTLSDVDMLLDYEESAATAPIVSLSNDIVLTKGSRSIRPKTAGQKRYIDAISEHTVTFGLGPAGTGKTYLAMAMAIASLKRKDVSRIVLVRPVVEAGESLGFLPGTLEKKLDPYVRPLYDALFDMVDREHANSLIEQGIIEIAPLAFMRGRTMNDAFVILDEAQNTTPEQMKMFLTRLGFSSKFVITGDTSQRDLLGESGLDVARRVLHGLDDIAFIDLGREDIVRHALVAKIVEAYERSEKDRQQGKGAR